MQISKILLILFMLVGVGVFAQPANDNCAGAIGLTVEVNDNCSSIPYSNVGATADPQNPSCWGSNSDNGIWFSFVAPATGSLMISTNFGFNTINDPQIAVFSGGCGGLTEIACQEDLNTGGGLLNNRLAVNGLTGGNTYWILLDGNSGETGDCGICLTETPTPDDPEYSDCNANQFICSSDPVVQGDFNGTQGDLNEPGSCFGAAENRSHWYEFVANTTGQLRFAITPTTPIDYDWALFDITSGCPGVEVGCSWTGCLGDGSGTTGAGCANTAGCGAIGGVAPCEPAIGVVAGRRYALMVDRFSAGTSGFVLDFSGSTFDFGGLSTPDFLINNGGCGGVSFIYLEPEGTLEYLWDFGDGSGSTEKNPSHSYGSPGTYDVTLIIKANPGECTNRVSKQVTITGGTEIAINPVTPFCPGESRVLNSTVTPTSTGNYNKTWSNNTPVAVVSNATRNSPIVASCLNPNDWSIVRVCMNISHTWMSDMQVRLVAPNGTLINLANRIGGSNSGYVNTCFTNGGNPRVNTGAYPYTGDWTPQQNPGDFSGFTGFDPNGTWNLRVNDDTGGDDGTIENWTITFQSKNGIKSYTWTPGGSLSNATIANPTASPITSTLYTLTVEEYNCCSGSGTIQVNVNPDPPAPSVSDIEYCEGETTNPLVATGINITWYDDAALTTQSASQPPTPSSATGGTTSYFATQTSADGCEGPAAELKVKINGAPNLRITNNEPTICSGEVTDIVLASDSAGTQYSFVVLNVGPNITGSANGTGGSIAQTLNNTGAAAETVEYEITPSGPSPTFCTGAKQTVTVTVNPKPILPGVDSPVEYCKNEATVALTATPNGANTLLWYTTASGGVGDPTAPTPSSATAGTTTYYVSQIDAAGCESDRAEIEVVINDLPPAPTVADVEYCLNELAAILSATGLPGATFNWFDGAMSPLAGPPTPNTSVAGDPAESFFVSQTSDKNCTGPTAQIDVKIEDKPDITATPDNEAFCSGGETNIALSSTNPSATFAWVISSAGANITGQAAGSGAEIKQTLVNSGATDQTVVYEVTPTGAAPNSCVGDPISVTITVYAIPVAPTVAPVKWCKDSTADPLTATGTNLQWYTDAAATTLNADQPPTPNTSALGNPAESHYLTQTINGCESLPAQLDVEVVDSPVVTLVSKDCNGTNTQYQVTVSITGGDATSYMVNDGSGFAAHGGGNYTTGWINNGDPYTISVTDANGCKVNFVTGTHLCNCTTNAGEFINTGTVHHFCENGVFSIGIEHDKTNLNQDADDILEYILHDNFGALDDVIYLRNTSGSFSFGAPLVLEQSYWVTAVVASDADANGEVDFMDGCLDFTDPIEVIWHGAPDASISANQTVCKGQDASIEITLTGTPDFSFDYIENGTAKTENGFSGTSFVINFTEIQADQSVTLVKVYNNYNCETIIDQVSNIVVQDSIKAEFDRFECNGTGDKFKVYINITNGDPAALGYTSPTGHTGSFSGTVFESDWITDFDNYHFIFSDGTSCNNKVPEILGQHKCNCLTAIGSLVNNSGQNPYKVCGTDMTGAISYNNTGENLDPNDNRAFYLHSSSGTGIAGIVAGPSPSPSGFSFGAGMTYGTTYYITGAAGNAVGAGVDFADPCVQYTSGIPVAFYETPGVNIYGSTEVCFSDLIEVNMVFQGQGPFVIAGTAEIDGNYDGDSTFFVSPNATGTITYTINSISNANCSQAVNKTMTVIVNDSPSIDATSVEAHNCNAFNTGYTVTFSISGGLSGNYAVTGEDGNGDPITGTLTGNTYVSNEIPTSVGYTFYAQEVGGNCTPDSLLGIFTCPCETAVGTMTAITTPTPLCGETQVNASYDTSAENWDGNDGTEFILTDALPIGTIIKRNSTPQFDVSAEIIAGTILYNTPYYMIAVTGDIAGTQVDLNDPCLQVSNGLEVRFFPAPMGDLSANTNLICENAAFEVILTLNGTQGADFTVSVSDGTNTVASGTIVVSGGTLSITPPGPGNYSYVIESATDNISGCTALTFGTDLTGTVNIQVNPAPSVDLLGDQDFCFDNAGNSASLRMENFSGQGPFEVFVKDNDLNTFSWLMSGADSAVLMVLGQNPYVQTTSTFLLDSIKDTSPEQCKGLGNGVPVVFNVHPIPDIDLDLSEPLVCEGTAVQITGTNTVSMDGLSVDINGPGLIETKSAARGTDVLFTPVAPPVGTNLYTITGIRDNSVLGCVNTDSVYTASVEVNPLPTVFVYVPAANQICHGDSIQIFFDVTGNGIISFDYSDGLGNSGSMSVPAGNGYTAWVAPVNTTGTVQYSTFGVTNVQDQTPVSCPGTGSGNATIQINPIPTATIALEDPEICFGESTNLVFTGIGNGPISVLWSDGVGSVISSVNVGFPELYPVNPGVNTTYQIVQITDASNPSCVNNILQPTASLVVNQLPVGSIAGTDSLCFGEPFTFEFEIAGNAPFTVVVQDENGMAYNPYAGLFSGLNVANIVPDTTHIYSIQNIVDAKGCENTGTGFAFVEVFPSPIPDFEVDVFAACPPFDAVYVNLTDPEFLGAGSSVTWTLGEGQVSSQLDSVEAKYVNKQGGLHTITLEVVSPIGCYGRTDKLNYLQVYPMPIADFSFNPVKPDVINPNVHFYNESELANILIWSFKEDSASFTTNEVNPFYNFPDIGDQTYDVTLEVITVNGCRDTITKPILIKGISLINVPNSFTPNGDGTNDVFKPVMSGFIEGKGRYIFSIFNRWGELIFETSNPDEGWDGVYKGKESPQDNYVYRIVFKDSFSTEKVEHTGSVRLLR